MSLNDIAQMAENLLVITAANAVIAFGGTFIYLAVRETLARRKERKRREDDDIDIIRK